MAIWERITLSLFGEGMFVAFYTDYLEEVSYENRVYFIQHLQMLDELINVLLAKGVSFINSGLRRPRMPCHRKLMQSGRFG